MSVRGYFIVSADGRNGHDDAEREGGCAIMCACICALFFFFLFCFFFPFSPFFCFVSNEFTERPVVEPPFHRSAGVRA